MKERAEEAARKIDQNQYTNFMKTNVPPSIDLDVAKCICLFSNQDENGGES